MPDFYEIDWPLFGVGGSAEDSLDKIISQVSRVVAEDPSYPDQFPYTDCWQDNLVYAED